MTRANENIVKFHSHFSGVIWEIDNIIETQTADNMKITLYMVVLDTLSSIAYPEEKNRNRFTKFILTFGNCFTNKEKISIPNLLALLEKYPNKDFDVLKDYALGKRSNWHKDQPVYLENDLNLEEVKERWPRNDNKELMKLEGIGHDYLQHVNLLYSSRNSLVHQFIRLGWVFEELEVNDIFEPYYRHVKRTIHIQAPTDHWFLCYPTQFLSNLCNQSLFELSEHFRNTQFDPTSSYARGQYFIDELNR